MDLSPVAGMQAHCILLNIHSVKVLNEGQTPVDTCSQPLFAISIEAKYQNPVSFNDYVVLFDTLHSIYNNPFLKSIEIWLME